jgi:urea carboxylase system permease
MRGSHALSDFDPRFTSMTDLKEATPMSDTPINHPDPTDGLRDLGYIQELRRELGPFASFASGFSFVSILTTVFELFAFGFGLGGPAFFWTWPIVFIGQFCVALVFAELSVRFPVSGAIYQWSRRVSTDPLGWFAGWFMLIGYIVSVSAIAIAMQAALPGVWSGFQIVGGNASPTSPTGALNAIVLGSIVILICGFISAFGIKRLATLTIIGVSTEIFGVCLLIIILFTHTVRGPGVIMTTGGVEGHGSYVWPFLASMLMATYVMYGFDSAAELSEETRDPRRTAPSAITRCMLVSAVGGGLVLLGTLMASPSLGADLANNGIAYVLTAQAGNVLGRIMLAIVSVSIFSAALAIQASAARVMFSMARDGRLPFSRALSTVSSRTGTPLLPSVVVGVTAIGILLLSLGSASVFGDITSVAVVIVYLAYLLVTLPLLIQRLRGHPVYSKPPLAGHFTLGKWGLPVNLVAVVFGAVLMIDVGWPRAEIYNAGNGPWPMTWFAPLFILGATIVGAIAYPLMRRQAASKAVITPTALGQDAA